MCILLAPDPVSAAIRDLSARGAFIETNARPPLGSPVELRHPDAGTMSARIAAHAPDGIGIAFELDARAVAFVLAVVGGEMSRPAAQPTTQSERVMPCA